MDEVQLILAPGAMSVSWFRDLVGEFPVTNDFLGVVSPDDRARAFSEASGTRAMAQGGSTKTGPPKRRGPSGSGPAVPHRAGCNLAPRAMDDS